VKEKVAYKLMPHLAASGWHEEAEMQAGVAHWQQGCGREGGGERQT